jgi:hypothetical protein
MTPTFLVAKLCTYLFCPARFDVSLAQRSFYREVVGHLDIKLPFLIESQLEKNMGNPKVADFRRRMRGGTNDNDL